MKYLIFITLFIASQNLYSEEFLTCLEKEGLKRDESLRVAKARLKKENESCFGLPYEEEFFKCQYKAKQNFLKEEERIEGIFKLRRRACLKYPFL